STAILRTRNEVAASRRGRYLPAPPSRTPDKNLKAGSNPRAPGLRVHSPAFYAPAPANRTNARASDNRQNTAFRERLRRENSGSSLTAALPLRPPEQLSQPLQPLPQLGLESAVGRLVEALAANRLRGERLIRHPAGLVMGVAVALSPPELL